jgi:hypothetical protein
MLNEDHKAIASGKRKDDEGYMARVEFDQIERSIEKLRKVIKSKDQQLPAWVQSKITRAADFIDTAAEYLQSDEGLEEGKDPSFAVKKSSGAGALTPDAAKQLGSKAVELQKKKAASVGLPKIKKEEVSLVEKIIGEETCGKGMYWCNTDKVCKPLSKGFDVPGQSKKPTEVGIGKNVDGTQTCSHTKKGKSCPVHGKKECPMSEEKDPKGPVKAYKSPEEIAKKHGVSLEIIKKQLEMGIKVEGEHTSNKTSARITALQHLDEVPDYYSKLKKVESKKNVSEATRMQAKTGNIVAIIASWRGKYYTIQMFFPQSKIPSRLEITNEIQKIYPGSRVISYKVAVFKQGEPLIYAHKSGDSGKLGSNKNYIKPMGEQREIDPPKEKVDALTNIDIPQSERESARQRTLAKAAAIRKKREMKEEVEISEAKKSEIPCNKPKTQSHGSGEQGKSHVVKACENGKEKLIRFGQLGVKGSPKKKGESKEYASRRDRFKSRHAKNIAKGKMSAAYWANRVKW